MCIGITVLTMPPTVAALGYLSWFQGQSLCLERHSSSTTTTPRTCRNMNMNTTQLPPPPGWTATLAGFAAVPLVYYLQSALVFPLLESVSDADELKRQALHQRQPRQNVRYLTNKVSTQAQTGYVPPESMTQLAKQVGPPLALRIAATSIAFFCAGAFQVQVAQWRYDGQ